MKRSDHDEQFEQMWEQLATLPSPRLSIDLEQQLLEKLEHADATTALASPDLAITSPDHTDVAELWSQLCDLPTPVPSASLEAQLRQALDFQAAPESSEPTAQETISQAQLSTAWQQLCDLPAPSIPQGLEERLLARLDVDETVKVTAHNIEDITADEMWRSLSTMPAPTLSEDFEASLLQQLNAQEAAPQTALALDAEFQTSTEAWRLLSTMPAPTLSENFEATFLARLDEEALVADTADTSLTVKGMALDEESMWRAMRSLPAPSLSHDFEASFLQRLDAEEGATQRRRARQHKSQHWLNHLFRPGRLRLWGAVAATCAVLVVGVFRWVPSLTGSGTQEGQGITEPFLPDPNNKKAQASSPLKDLEMYQHLLVLQEMELLENLDLLQEWAEFKKRGS